MGRHKKSTKSRRANLSKTPTHKCHGVVHDRAPTEAKNSKEILLCASGIHSELLDPISQIYGWLLCWIGRATGCLGLQEVPWPPYIATRGSLGGQSTRLNRVLIN